jgi:hypothetical protein
MVEYTKCIKLISKEQIGVHIVLHIKVVTELQVRVNPFSNKETGNGSERNSITECSTYADVV